MATVATKFQPWRTRTACPQPANRAPAVAAAFLNQLLWSPAPRPAAGHSRITTGEGVLFDGSNMEGMNGTQATSQAVHIPEF